MNPKFLSFLLIVFFYSSCENRSTVDYQIEKIIYEYSKEYKLKDPNIYEDFSSKQSYEIGFFKNNEIDTLFYVGYINSYALKELSVIFSSSFSSKLKIEKKGILDYPLYMGSYFTEKDSLPIHIFDVIDKYGKDFYDFNKLLNLNFKEYFITEEYSDSYPPNLWIYKIKDNKFIKIAETDTMSYDIKKHTQPSEELDEI